MKVSKYAGLGVLLLAGNINLAQAIPYSVSGSFSNPGFSDPTSLHYLFNNDQGGNASLPAVAEFGWGVNFDALASSRFSFDGRINPDPDFIPTADIFPLIFGLGSFTYTNLETQLVGKTVTVDLNLNLAIGDPGDPVKQFNLDYALEVNNTSGTGTPDSMQIVSMTDKSSFNVDGTDYELALLGFGRGVTGFTLAENDTARMQLFARVDRVSAVPVPASIWLFSSALIGLAGVSRRTRKA
ncbi:MAG TPA: hypothetical protein ENI98_03910 [Gammaproteobacteria bacterium]|nr:hypothetical protein [Gammaproteobacteria bacterium]